MRLVVLTDAHANLPALDAALGEIERRGYDLLVHTGDAIGIGPFPAECLDRLRSLPDALLILGNHDAWFANGLPDPPPGWMSPGELAHQQWTHAQLDPGLRAEVAAWPVAQERLVGGLLCTFLHYPLAGTQDWIPIMRDPSVADLDRAFAAYPAPLICYGHYHPFSDMQGRARYINPGSLGCAATAHARYTTIEVSGSACTITHHTVPYDDAPLYRTFEDRQVPERAFIYRAFFGGRWSISAAAP